MESIEDSIRNKASKLFKEKGYTKFCFGKVRKSFLNRFIAKCCDMPMYKVEVFKEVTDTPCCVVHRQQALKYVAEIDICACPDCRRIDIDDIDERY